MMGLFREQARLRLRLPTGLSPAAGLPRGSLKIA
jgi:hypothetical protein